MNKRDIAIITILLLLVTSLFLDDTVNDDTTDVHYITLMMEYPHVDDVCRLHAAATLSGNWYHTTEEVMACSREIVKEMTDGDY